VQQVFAGCASGGIGAGASWCIPLLFTVPSGVIVSLERGQHFGDVSDRKNQLAIGVLRRLDRAA
jgi:hypothetical protein